MRRLVLPGRYLLIATVISGGLVGVAACGSESGSNATSAQPARTVVRTVTVPAATTAPAPAQTKVIIVSPAPGPVVTPPAAAPREANPRVYMAGGDTEAQDQLIGETYDGYTCDASSAEPISTVWSSTFAIDAAGCPGNDVMNLYVFNTDAERSAFTAAFTTRNGGSWTLFDSGFTPSGRSYVAAYHNG